MLIYNIFPTTVYVGEIENHEQHKNNFYRLYPKYDYDQVIVRNGKTYSNTISENSGNPLIHLEDSLEGLFEQVINNVKTYVLDVLKYQDIFDYVITKTWLSRSRAYHEEIPWHYHSTSHISFTYYLNMPPNSHSIKFKNPTITNNFFEGLGSSSYKDGVEERNNMNATTFFITPKEGSIVLFPSSLQHCTEHTSKEFDGERLAIVGDITLVFKENSSNDYSMGYINPKYWRIYK